MWGSKGKVDHPYPSREVCNPGFRGGMLYCRRGNFGFPRSLSRVSHMEVRIFSRYILSYSLSDIHLHTSMMNCLGFVIISWGGFFLYFFCGRERNGLDTISGGKCIVY